MKGKKHMSDIQGGLVLVLAYFASILAIGVLVNLMTGCANDGKLEAWQDCAGIHHEECRGDLACEYEFYKECINE